MSNSSSKVRIETEVLPIKKNATTMSLKVIENNKQVKFKTL